MAKTEGPRPVRYHKALVVMHWLTAVFVLTNLTVGWFLFEASEGESKFALLQLHVAFGFAAAGIVLPRLLTRIFTRRPADAENVAPLRWTAKAVHWLFYLLVLAMGTSGYGLALESGLFKAFRGEGPVPEDFSVFMPYKGHEITAAILTVFVIVHLLGVAYHQLVRKDGLLSRMGWGPRYGA